MAKKPKSLPNQFQYVIGTATAKGIGRSKYADRQNNATEGKVYAIKSADRLRATARSFAQWATANTDIEYLKDVTAEHWHEWANADGRINNWSDQTKAEYASRIQTLAILTSACFNLKPLNWKLTYEQSTTAYMIRDIAITEEHLKLLEADLMKRRSKNGYNALMVSSKIGCRVEEMANIKGSDIDTVNWTVHLEECKGGYKRKVPIQPEDYDFFEKLKKQKGDQYVTGGILPDSINSAIRASMHRCGISDTYPRSTEHSIRKFWARKLHEDEEKNISWETLLIWLGHRKTRKDKKLRYTYLGY